MTSTQPAVVATNDVGVLRPILAIVAGIIIVGALTGCADLIVQKLIPARFSTNGRTADPLVLCLMLTYITAFAFLAGSVAATLARRSVRMAVYAFAALQLLFGGIAAVKLSSGMPMWWTSLSVLLPVAAILIGGLTVRPRAT